MNLIQLLQNSEAAEEMQALSHLHNTILQFQLAQLEMLARLLAQGPPSPPPEGMKCPVCMDEEDELIRLPCRHFYGRSCLKETLLQQINQRGIHMVPCVPPCEKQITVEDFLFYATPEERTMFEEKLFDLNIISGIKPDEKIIYCGNQKCKARVAIWKEADFFTCPSCKLKQCAKCLRSYHESKVSCSQAFLQQLSKKELEQIQNMVNLGMRMCPHCLGYIQKNGGCNLMTCFSDVCKGNKYFCWLCLEKLARSNSFDHYEGLNPFNEKCRGLLKLMNQTKKNQEQNKVPCPRCKTKDPEICELIENLGNLVCYCKRCKNHICTSCHKDVQVNQLEHHFRIGNDGIKCNRCVIF